MARRVPRFVRGGKNRSQWCRRRAPRSSHHDARLRLKLLDATSQFPFLLKMQSLCRPSSMDSQLASNSKVKIFDTRLSTDGDMRKQVVAMKTRTHEMGCRVPQPEHSTRYSVIPPKVHSRQGFAGIVSCQITGEFRVGCLRGRAAFDLPWLASATVFLRKGTDKQPGPGPWVDALGNRKTDITL